MAQGINKKLTIAKQVAKGTPIYTGGQSRRRRTAMFSKARDTYENDEIVDHQQGTGATAGVERESGKVAGLLSPLTYSLEMAAVTRASWAAITAMTAMSITIAGAGPNYTATRATGDFLAAGMKAGRMFRFTAGSMNAANLNTNFMCVAVTATVITFRAVNGFLPVTEGPITGVTLTVPGKAVMPPLTGHTDDWFTVQEWYPDVPSAEVFPDMKPGAMAIVVPNSGNVTIDMDWIGLTKLKFTTDQMVTPAAATTTPVVQAASGIILVGGNTVAVTNISFTIDPTVTPGEAEVGSNTVSDVNKGRIKVSGSFTSKFSSTVLSDLFDAQSLNSLIVALTTSKTANADFLAFSMGAVKIMGDAPDDGEKEIIRTYPFTAEINGSGGAALAWDKTILTIQDSTVP